MRVKGHEPGVDRGIDSCRRRVLRPAEPQPCDGGHISNGQGFLGNDNQVNGTATPFYAGIGCPDSTPTVVSNVVTSSCIDPAIFQTTNGGLDTVTLSNIEVDDPEGDLATGYEVITADAETIDPGGYIKWTSSLPASQPLPFNLVPNFSYLGPWQCLQQRSRR